MRHITGELAASHAATLFYQSWRPEDEPRAVLILIHGFGEHGGRYNYLVDYLVPRGYAVYALDLYGHGRSPGQRGGLSEWEQYVQDADALVNLVKREEPNLPRFIMGHSMGGLIVASYLLDHQAGLNGAVLSAPLLEEANVSPLIKTAMKLLNRVTPGLSLSTSLDAGAISREPEEVLRYQQDSLNHDKASVRLGNEMLRMAPEVHRRAGEIVLPLLIYHGEGDQLVPISGSRRLADEVGSTDCTFVAYPGGYHELHNDLDRATVLADLYGWLERHL
ncbi:MAG: lysophospholipase [Caldilineaceae bacterium]|nr:lysophospholipase [Caldilineaceae bacterium]